MNSSINKLTNYQYTTAKCLWVCFSWGLFLKPVVRLRVLGCPLNATGLFVQGATLLEMTTQLVDDIGHRFSNILLQFECNGASFWAIPLLKLLNFTVTHHFVAPFYSLPLYKCLWCWQKLSKMVGNSAIYALRTGYVAL